MVMSQYQKDKSLPIVSINLKALRGDRSQAEFAAFLQIPNQVTYHRYENGRTPKIAILEKIAFQIGITVDELLNPIPPERLNEIGCLTPIVSDGRRVVESFLESLRKADKIRVDSSDFQRGYMDLSLEYRIGNVPKGCPKTLRVKSIGSIEAAKMLPQISSKRGAIIDVFINAIPAKYRNDEFLDQLTATCVSSMACVAMLLSFGLAEGREILTSLGYYFSDK
jgi:transcriptional regulator with XRE-family HTH domain